MYGIPAAMAAVAAARTSSGADIVSIQMTSAPPAASPSICSRKTATASSWVSAPSGSNRSPVGPTEPATTTGRSAASATPRAMAAAALASSATRCSARWRANRLRLHPNVLVRMMSAPASTKRWCRLATRAGMVDVPELRRLTGLEPHLEVVRARRPVGEEHRSGTEQVGESALHPGNATAAWAARPRSNILAAEPDCQPANRSMRRRGRAARSRRSGGPRRGTRGPPRRRSR